MSAQREATVFVVDDDIGARESVCALAESMGLATRGFGSAEEFLASNAPTQPGCLVTDMRMVGMSGLELQEQLRRDGIALPVIVITAFAETATTVRAMRGGAVTLLEKPCSDQTLWDAIREAISMDAANRERAARRCSIRQRIAALTQQERRVMDFIIDGLPNKAIAAKLDVSVRTVESRRRSVFQKLQAESLPELVRMVMAGQRIAS